MYAAPTHGRMALDKYLDKIFISLMSQLSVKRNKITKIYVCIVLETKARRIRRKKYFKWIKPQPTLFFLMIPAGFPSKVFNNKMYW